ncbi:MAG: CinA family protein [Pseudomonadota bacterium]
MEANPLEHSDAALQKLARQVSDALRTRAERIATAESCTGGWIAKVLTDLPGSSAVFSDGFITYSDEAKISRLAVARRVIETHGAVSAQVVKAMAAGALAHSGSQVAVAVSGIAGPGGARPGKPVGTVWIGWQHIGGGARQTEFQFPGDREAVRRASVAEALYGALRSLAS